MTNPKDRTASTKDRAADHPPQKPDKDHELDAEILRDLEPDEQSDDVRGGACPRSQIPHAGV